MTFDNYINSLFERAKYDIDNYIEMLCISAKCKPSSVESDIKGFYGEYYNGDTEFSKEITESLIESYLKKRGYVLNVVLGRPVWVNGFVCVCIHNGLVEIWHDIKNSKSSFVDKSMLTGLPIALNYFERNMKYKA